jgi:hypothetical protein
MTEHVVVVHADRQVLFTPDAARGASIGSFLRRGEFYEAAMLEYVRRLRLTGPYVDAGAAVGTHTLFFSAVCDAEHVYSFEPRDWVFDLLRRNIALNGLDERITAEMVGLSDGFGEAQADLDGSTVTFPTKPLDACLSADVEVVKIDVENMETRVIDGAAELLRRSGPIVFAEAWSAAAYGELVDCLARHAYVPTGHYFNATPTFEFRRKRRLRGPLGKGDRAAYADLPAQPRPGFTVHEPAPATLAVLRSRAIAVVDRAPWAGRTLRRSRDRVRRWTGRG